MTDEPMPPIEKRKPGGQPGNKNKVKHGLTSRDAKFRAMWRSLTPEQREYLLPMLKQHGSELETTEEYIARLEAGQGSPATLREPQGERTGRADDLASIESPSPTNVTPFPTFDAPDSVSERDSLSRSLLYRERETDNESSNRSSGSPDDEFGGPPHRRSPGTVYSAIDQRRLMGDLVSLRFMRAKEFVEKHVPVLQLVDDLIDEVRAQQEAGVGVGLSNPPAWIRKQFHEEVMEFIGSLRQCPYCFKQEYVVLPQSVQRLDGGAA